MRIVNLTEEQTWQVVNALDDYNNEFGSGATGGCITIGLKENGEIIAGLVAEITAFRILYVSTVFVKEEYRRKGCGRKLMTEMEKRAKKLGANMIRLDTFDFQGREFYDALGYEQVGHYRNDEDNFEEFFYIKKL